MSHRIFNWAGTVLLLTVSVQFATAQYKVTDLGALEGGSAVPRALNSNGDVAGRSGHAHGSHTRGFLWTHGRMIGLGALPAGDYSSAAGVNDLGQVAGWSNTANSLHAFLWTTSSGLRDLGTLPGDSSSQAWAINDSGVVVGASTGPGGTRAFLWTSTAGMQDLGSLPGDTESKAHAINQVGQVA